MVGTALGTEAPCRSAVCDLSLEVRGEVCTQNSSAGFCHHVGDKP